MTRRRLGILSLVLAAAGCGATPTDDDVTVVRGALNNIVISGKVKDAAGNGLPGVTVTLAGSASRSQVTTGTGNYSFGSLGSGSYSVRPTKTSCAFKPDVVNLNNLNASTTRDFTGSGSGCAAAVAPVTRKYMKLVYNPIIESQGGQRIIPLMGWNDPDTLTTQFVTNLTQGTNGLVNYVEGAPKVELDAYPVKEDGFQYTDATFMACQANVANCHKPGQEMGFGYAINYLTMLTSNNICARFNAGEFDELWMFGAPFMGFWEANQAGSQAIDTNGPIVVGSTCQGRLNIFGFAYHVGVANMLHDYGHRIEGTMRNSLPVGNPLWEQYTRNDLQNPGQAQCGKTHFPPTAGFEYNYDNARSVTSSCDDWLNYPNRTGATTTITCSAWGCEERGYHVWWMQHLPHVAGTAADGTTNNWWTYIVDTRR
jgi:Carboxypeptidase regulatory-like domain